MLVQTLALMLVGSAQEPPAAPARPNVLVVLTDDMGYGDLSCYGSTQVPTPNIDRLADGGVRCTQGYVSSLVCAPSRAGLMTGRYQNRFGFEHNLSTPEHVRPEWCGLPTDEVTMADRLRTLGYRTMAVGKWHLGEQPRFHPQERGFDAFFGFLRGSHGYFPTLDKNALERNGDPVDAIRTPYLTDWLTLEAIDWMTADHGDAPWFCYLAYNTPHTPLQAKDIDLERFASVQPKKRRLYCAMQHNLDVNVGRILASLEESDQLEDTLIVFLSDNGGSCDASFAINAPLRGQKSMVLEGGMRVPFLLHWPGGLPRGLVYDDMVSSLDLVPTFVVAGGGRIGKDERLDGVNLRPYIDGRLGDLEPHDTLYWRISQRGAAIRSGEWKLVRLPHRAPELYRISVDVSERTNLASKFPDRVADLLLDLHGWECSFERNPMWESGVRWAQYNRNLYGREYTLSQPK